MSATTSPAANDPAAPKLFLPGESLPAGAGMKWIREGWDLFKRTPLMWIVMIVLVFVSAVIVSFVPFIGTLAFQIVTPAIAAGFVAGCWSLDNNGELEIEHLFAGFKRNFSTLAIVGLLYMAGGLVILVVMFMSMGASLLPALLMGTGDAEVSAAALGTMGLGMLIGVLVACSLGLLLAAAYWFAPALVIMHNLGAVDAMKASFFACFRNFVPFIVYGLVMLLLLIPVGLTLGLGILVWVPVAIASSYRAYRQIFTEA